jgi:2,3-bisphosphoglycerate-independent phosphoglycerate mutase
MKYVVILGDGMADYPIASLGNQTPLQTAATPWMDYLAHHGQVGMVKTVPEGFPPGSDVANLSVMGYDPRLYYTGRSPLEAVSMGVTLGENDVAFRCNLVTLSPETTYTQKTMIDYSADEISSAEAKELITTVNKHLGNNTFNFYAGVSYRHLMVWRNGPQEFQLTPPHDISDQQITAYLPKGNQSDLLLSLMKTSNALLPTHPVNQLRIQKGLKPANSLWFWGQGKKPLIPLFTDKYHLSGSVISAVDLTKGLGLCAGLEIIEVPGATGNITTNFTGKARAAITALKQGKDFVYIHIEAPDEAGHRGELETKIKAIEAIDTLVVKEVLEGLSGFTDYKIMILPDHPTPLCIRTHSADAVPFLIYQKSTRQANKIMSFNEQTAEATGTFLTKGHTLMDYFIGQPVI